MRPSLAIASKLEQPEAGREGPLTIYHRAEFDRGALYANPSVAGHSDKKALEVTNAQCYAIPSLGRAAR